MDERPLDIIGFCRNNIKIDGKPFETRECFYKLLAEVNKVITFNENGWPKSLHYTFNRRDGKTTMALSLALSLCFSLNNFNIAYISPNYVIRDYSKIIFSELFASYIPYPNLFYAGNNFIKFCSASNGLRDFHGISFDFIILDEAQVMQREFLQDIEKFRFVNNNRIVGTKLFLYSNDEY